MPHWGVFVKIKIRVERAKLVIGEPEGNWITGIPFVLVKASQARYVLPIYDYPGPIGRSVGSVPMEQRSRSYSYL